MSILKRVGIDHFVEIRDPVFSFISVPVEFEKILDHRFLQRLRWIGQLPLEQLVYPSAQHSRFEHSVGTMHLAMLAAWSLLKNSKIKINAAFGMDPLYSGKKTHVQEKFFILSAGLIGLLHDLGHAPFSHTFEEASKHSKIKFKYHHEKIGLLLAKALLSEVFKGSFPVFATTTLKVLNKELKFENVACSPVDRILRKLIDGSIDVDKGDYIYRDSYHCGTNYGIYDIRQLWQHVVVTDEFDIGVDKKGALEAWSLRIARYKMHKNVYKHHVRNITDALLIEIISRALSKKKGPKKGICPFSSESICDNELSEFVYWSDSNLIKSLSGVESRIDHLIESYLKRNLYKRGDIFPLSGYPNLIAPSNKEELVRDVEKVKRDFEKRGVNFNFHINSYEIPPVFSSCVQNEIKVVQPLLSDVSLAQFLGFSAIGKIPNDKAKEVLELFFAESDLESYRGSVKTAVEEKMNKFKTSIKTTDVAK